MFNDHSTKDTFIKRTQYYSSVVTWCLLYSHMVSVIIIHVVMIKIMPKLTRDTFSAITLILFMRSNSFNFLKSFSSRLSVFILNKLGELFFKSCTLLCFTFMIWGVELSEGALTLFPLLLFTDIIGTVKLRLCFFDLTRFRGDKVLFRLVTFSV